MNRIGGAWASCVTCYNPVCIGSDLISVYLTNYTAQLFKIWREKLEEKLMQPKLEMAIGLNDQDCHAKDTER